MRLAGLTREHVILVVALLIYLAPIMASIHLGGLNEDDALTVIPVLEFLHGKPIDPPTAAFQVGGRDVPWVIGPYTGLLHPMENLVGLWLFGYNLPVIRLWPTLFAAATLALAYAICYLLFSRTAANVVALLLAVNPVFAFWFWLEGYHTYSSMAAVVAASIFSFLLYLRTDRARFLYLGAFLSGMGLAMKLNFGYWLFIFSLAGLIIAVPRLRRAPVQTAGLLVGGLVAFVLGAAPWLSLVYKHPERVSFLTGSLAGGSSLGGVDNASFSTNLDIRLTQLWNLFAGVNVDFGFGCPGYQTVNHWTPVLLVVSYVTVLALALWPRTSFRRSALLFVVLSLPVLVIMSTRTPSTLHMYNATIYFPIPHIIMAIAVTLVIHRVQAAIRQPRLALAVAAAIVLLVMAPDARQTYAMYDMLHQTDGCGRMSGAIHDVSAYLLERGYLEPVAMDWGLYFPIRLVSGDQVRPVENFTVYWEGRYWNDNPPPIVAERLRGFLDDPNRAYLFYASPFRQVHGRLELLERMAAERGKRLEVERAFPQRNGEILYLVYRVV